MAGGGLGGCCQRADVDIMSRPPSKAIWNAGERQLLSIFGRSSNEYSGGMVARIMLGMALAVGGLAISACGLWQSTARVDPGLVAEMRTLGRVVANTTSEWYYDGDHDIFAILVIDVGATDADRALDQVVERLELHGWKTSTSSRHFVSMESRQWPARIFVEPLPSSGDPSSDGLNPELDASNAKLFDGLRQQKGAGGYVVLTAEPR
jgi:hypothetical protein